MVSKRKKKYSVGEGAQFMSRKSALKKLQLSLKDFRRLCIIKGIYPREPRNRKRAQKGATGIKTLYHKKDVQFLMHEPIIWKLRDYKIFNKKVGRAKAMRDFAKMKRYLDSHPSLKLDHIVKERYPTFIDALRDLDDCLTLCFLFSTFPSLKHINRAHSSLCRRLTTEFMHAVIEAKALRKVFISIKGYYYQAEIKGQTVTWIVPHHFAFEPQSKEEVDFKIMSTFVEFYTVMLGFVNFRLYHTLNLTYPPRFSNLSGPTASEKSLVDEEQFVAERIAALSYPISRLSAETVDEDVAIDVFDMDDDPQKLEEKKLEAEKVKQLKTLFKGLKFFMNREVPREPLVFIIRCFGGEVSWDKLFLGSTFDETDETITHHIVDRPNMNKQFISRYYIQPQWVFDSVNSRELLPVSKYFIGAVLPPHLSPFIDMSRDEVYIPPEERALRDPSLVDTTAADDEEDSESEELENDDDPKTVDEDDSDDEEMDDGSEDEDESSEEEMDEDEKAKKEKKEKMVVTPGQIHKPIPWAKNQQERQEFRLREKMIKKKHKNLYKSMMASRNERAKETWLLRKKRRLHDEREAEEKKQMKVTNKKQVKVADKKQVKVAVKKQVK